MMNSQTNDGALGEVPAARDALSQEPLVRHRHDIMDAASVLPMTAESIVSKEAARGDGGAEVSEDTMMSAERIAQAVRRVQAWLARTRARAA